MTFFEQVLASAIGFTISTFIVKVIKHIAKWNRWRKQNTNSKWHKFMVLVGLHNSPTMDWTL